MPKPPLLLVHGMIGSLAYFDPAARITRASVHPIDLPGYGSLGNAGPEQLSLTCQADHVVACLKEISRQPAWLLGHSMGGAVVMLAADRAPDLVAGIINVEGNFTLKDAFWSTRIVRKTPEDWADEYRRMQADVPAWLTRCGIDPDPRREAWMTQVLANQSADTVYAISRAIIEETRPPAYLETIRRVTEQNLPLHLIAGQKSASAWDVPDFVRAAAASYTEQADVGHLMMLEEPGEFCRLVDACLT
jgi:pimeloyl-ACP methyl ester carboxylesterase